MKKIATVAFAGLTLAGAALASPDPGAGDAPVVAGRPIVAVPRPSAARLEALLADTTRAPVGLRVREAPSPIELREFYDALMLQYGALLEGTSAIVRALDTAATPPRFGLTIADLRTRARAEALCGLLELPACEIVETKVADGTVESDAKTDEAPVDPDRPPRLKALPVPKVSSSPLAPMPGTKTDTDTPAPHRSAPVEIVVGRFEVPTDTLELPSFGLTTDTLVSAAVESAASAGTEEPDDAAPERASVGTEVAEPAGANVASSNTPVTAASEESIDAPSSEIAAEQTPSSEDAPVLVQGVVPVASAPTQKDSVPESVEVADAPAVAVAAPAVETPAAVVATGKAESAPAVSRGAEDTSAAGLLRRWLSGVRGLFGAETPEAPVQVAEVRPATPSMPAAPAAPASVVPVSAEPLPAMPVAAPESDPATKETTVASAQPVPAARSDGITRMPAIALPETPVVPLRTRPESVTPVAQAPAAPAETPSAVDTPVIVAAAPAETPESTAGTESSPVEETAPASVAPVVPVASDAPVVSVAPVVAETPEAVVPVEPASATPVEEPVATPSPEKAIAENAPVQAPPAKVASEPSSEKAEVAVADATKFTVREERPLPPPPKLRPARPPAEKKEKPAETDGTRPAETKKETPVAKTAPAAQAAEAKPARRATARPIRLEAPQAREAKPRETASRETKPEKRETAPASPDQVERPAPDAEGAIERVTSLPPRAPESEPAVSPQAIPTPVPPMATAQPVPVAPLAPAVGAPYPAPVVTLPSATQPVYPMPAPQPVRPAATRRATPTSGVLGSPTSIPMFAEFATVEGSENAWLELNRLRMVIPALVMRGFQLYAEPVSREGRIIYRVAAAGPMNEQILAEFCATVQRLGEECTVRVR